LTVFNNIPCGEVFTSEYSKTKKFER